MWLHVLAERSLPRFCLTPTMLRAWSLQSVSELLLRVIAFQLSDETILKARQPTTSRRANSQAAVVQNDLNELKRQENELNQKVQAVRRSLSPDQLQSLEATHVLVDRKQFSWSLLFADLETALPGSVRVKRIAVKGV